MVLGYGVLGASRCGVGLEVKEGMWSTWRIPLLIPRALTCHRGVAQYSAPQ